jgi:hypothetical protein
VQHLDLGSVCARGAHLVDQERSEGLRGLVELRSNPIELGVGSCVLLVLGDRSESAISVPDPQRHLGTQLERIVVGSVMPFGEGGELVDLGPGGGRAAWPLDSELATRRAERSPTIVQEIAESNDAPRKVAGVALGVEHVT